VPLVLTPPLLFGMTPGASSASVSSPLPAAFDGNSSILRLSTVCDSCDCSRWTTSSAPAVTVTVSATSPASNLTLSGLTMPALINTPTLLLRLKPAASTATV
jgi:hypothetical protein